MASGMIDAGPQALLRVDVKGNREVISSPAVGEGDLIPGPDFRPRLNTWERTFEAARDAGVMVY